jgi:hypothetical protein
MNGLQMLLASFGVRIDPAEIETAFRKGKEVLPQIARAFEEMDARMSRMEKQIGRLVAWTEDVDRTEIVLTEDVDRTKTKQKPNGVAVLNGIRNHR